MGPFKTKKMNYGTTEKYHALYWLWPTKILGGPNSYNFFFPSLKWSKNWCLLNRGAGVRIIETLSLLGHTVEIDRWPKLLNQYDTFLSHYLFYPFLKHAILLALVANGDFRSHTGIMSVSSNPFLSLFPCTWPYKLLRFLFNYNWQHCESRNCNCHSIYLWLVAKMKLHVV